MKIPDSVLTEPDENGRRYIRAELFRWRTMGVYGKHGEWQTVEQMQKKRESASVSASCVSSTLDKPVQ